MLPVYPDEHGLSVASACEQLTVRARPAAPLDVLGESWVKFGYTRNDSMYAWEARKEPSFIRRSLSGAPFGAK